MSARTRLTGSSRVVSRSCGLALLQFRFEEAAQGLDDGGHLDQRAGGGGVVAVERQLQLAGLRRLRWRC